MNFANEEAPFLSKKIINNKFYLSFSQNQLYNEKIIAALICFLSLSPAFPCFVFDEFVLTGKGSLKVKQGRGSAK